MRKSLHGRAAAIVVAAECAVVVLAFGGCSDGSPRQQAAIVDPQCDSGALKGAGATFQQNVQQHWINNFTTRCPTVTVTYESIGSGEGIRRFITGTIDFAGSDAVMTPEEQRAANARCATGAGAAGRLPRALHLPVVGGAVVFIFNLPGVESLRLSATTVAGLFQRDIVRWDDPRIAADNPGVRLPALPVSPVHRTESSGTTDVLSRYLTVAAGPAWRLGTGKVLSWPEGVADARGSDGVTKAVVHEPGGITYAELSFAAEHGLPTAALLNAAGTYVKANMITVVAAIASAHLVETSGDIRLAMDFATSDPAAYPASAVTYIIVCDSGNTHLGPLRSYLTYVLTGGQETTSTIGYAPLPDLVATKARRIAVALN